IGAVGNQSKMNVPPPQRLIKTNFPCELAASVVGAAIGLIWNPISVAPSVCEPRAQPSQRVRADSAPLVNLSLYKNGCGSARYARSFRQSLYLFLFPYIGPSRLQGRSLHHDVYRQI